LESAPPEYPVAKEVRRPNGELLPGLKLTLYQYATCPFCCKVRSFLNYYGVDFDVIEVNSVTRKQVRIVR